MNKEEILNLSDVKIDDILKIIPCTHHGSLKKVMSLNIKDEIDKLVKNESALPRMQRDILNTIIFLAYIKNTEKLNQNEDKVLKKLNQIYNKVEK